MQDRKRGRQGVERKFPIPTLNSCSLGLRSGKRTLRLISAIKSSNGTHKPAAVTRDFHFYFTRGVYRTSCDRRFAARLTSIGTNPPLRDYEVSYSRTTGSGSIKIAPSQSILGIAARSKEISRNTSGRSDQRLDSPRINSVAPVAFRAIQRLVRSS